jgi:hypothetical protein
VNTQNISVSQFNLLDDLEDDDVISHKMPNIRRHANDLDEHKSKEDKSIVEKAVESVPQISK